MVFTEANASAIDANTVKVSAGGPIDTHNDVTISNIEVGNLIVWDGTSWINVTPDYGITEEAKDVIAVGTAVTTSDGTINTHNDVMISNRTIGDILVWDGSNWINIPYTSGITPQMAEAIIANTAKVSADGPVSTHSDVETTLPNLNDTLLWDGTNWVNWPPANVPIASMMGFNPGDTFNKWARDLTRNWNGSAIFNPCGIPTPVNVNGALIPAVMRITSTGVAPVGNTQTNAFQNTVTVDPSNPLRNRGLQSKPFYAMFGLENLYNIVRPFADELRPSMTELKAWNIRVLNHFRVLIARTDAGVVADERLDLEAQWKNERWLTTIHGPMQLLNNPLRMTSTTITPFIPSLAVQASYTSSPTMTASSGNVRVYHIHFPVSYPWSYHMMMIIAMVWSGVGLDNDWVYDRPFFSGSNRMGQSIMTVPGSTDLCYCLSFPPTPKTFCQY